MSENDRGISTPRIIFVPPCVCVSGVEGVLERGERKKEEKRRKKE